MFWGSCCSKNVAETKTVWATKKGEKTSITIINFFVSTVIQGPIVVSIR